MSVWVVHNGFSFFHAVLGLIKRNAWGANSPRRELKRVPYFETFIHFGLIPSRMLPDRQDLPEAQVPIAPMHPFIHTGMELVFRNYINQFFFCDNHRGIPRRQPGKSDLPVFFIYGTSREGLHT